MPEKINMKNDAPNVDVVVVNYNGAGFIEDCLDCLEKTDYPNDRMGLICIDNGSTDGSPDLVASSHPKVRLIFNKTNNYAGANNIGIRSSRAKYIVLLNHDTKPDPGWLSPLVDAMEADPGLGAVQSKLCFFDGTLQSVGHIEAPDFYWVDRGMGEQDQGQYDSDSPLPCPSLCGACVMYSKKCLEDVGLLDEFFNMFMEDVDMAVRASAAGWKLACVTKSRVLHYGHGAIRTEDAARQWREKNRLVLIAKHWPEQLADNLAGRGYFLDPENGGAQGLVKAAARACDKLMTEHDEKTFRPVMAQIFEKLSKISDPEKDLLVKQAAHRLKDREQDEARLYAEIDRLRDLVMEREDEIRLLKQSKGYRYIVAPLRTVADRIREMAPPLRQSPAIKKPFIPRIVSMKFTNNCQYKCRMCGIWSQEQREELSTDQWKRIIDQVYDWLGPFRLDVAGGEPLLRKDNDELVAHAAKMGVETVVLSNGGLINRDRARKLLESGLDSIHISLDSLRPELYDRMRGVDGAFSNAIGAIKSLKDLRVYRRKDFGIGIAVIVMAPNLEELPKLARYVHEGGADFISFQPLDQNFHQTYEPRWWEKNKYWIKDPDGLDRAVDELKGLKSRGCPIDNSHAQLDLFKHYFRDPEKFCRQSACLSGEKNFIIDVNGDALLCWNLPPVGNILSDPPEKIWNSAEALRRRKDIERCSRTCRILSCHFSPADKAFPA